MEVTGPRGVSLQSTRCAAGRCCLHALRRRLSQPPWHEAPAQQELSLQGNWFFSTGTIPESCFKEREINFLGPQKFLRLLALLMMMTLLLLCLSPPCSSHSPSQRRGLGFSLPSKVAMIPFPAAALLRDRCTTAAPPAMPCRIFACAAAARASSPSPSYSQFLHMTSPSTDRFQN